MRVLITGHNGYIGSVMAPILRAAGHDVTGLDTYFFEQCTFGDDSGGAPSLRKDVRDVTISDLQGFDAVVHLAALSNDPLGDLNPEWTREINHAASVRLATLAKEAGVRRFLFSSSCSMYGANGEELLTEESPLRPLTAYAASKVRAEEDLAALADDAFTPVFMRSATAYGVSPRLRADVVLNNLVAWAFTTGRVYIKSDGTPWRPIVHVEDISRSFLAALQAPRQAVHNQAFNVGLTAENYQIRELADIVKDTVPGCRIEYAKDGGPDRRCYRVDFGKIARVLPDFSPRWTARSGAQQLYQTYRKVGLSPEDFEGPRYQRIERIRQLLANGRLNSALRWKTRTAA